MDEKVKKIKNFYFGNTNGWKRGKYPWMDDIQTLLSLLEENEKEIEKLRQGILKDHNGCLIHRDEEYTKLESKFYQAEIRIKKLEEGIKEVLDGTLPYLAEKRLKKLIEEKE